MTEYPAMVYKTNRNRTYIASCIVKNVIGFGKTEEDAIKNLKKTIQEITKTIEVNIKPVYGFLKAQ